MHMLVFCHVEDVARNQQAIEAIQVEEAEEVYPEQQPQEIEVADQVEEQALDSNSANPNLQQGKHRFMYPSILPKFKFMQAPVHWSHLSLSYASTGAW